MPVNPAAAARAGQRRRRGQLEGSTRLRFDHWLGKLDDGGLAWVHEHLAELLETVAGAIPRTPEETPAVAGHCTGCRQRPADTAGPSSR